MKNKEMKVLGFYNDSVNRSIWLLLVAYIVLFNIATQLFDIQASTLSGIIIWIPIFLMMLWLVIISRGKIQIEFTYYHGYILAFGMFCLFSSLWAQSSELAIIKGMDVLKDLIIMTIISVCFQQKNDAVDSLLKAIMWGYYIVIAYEIIFFGWDYFVEVMQDSSRVTSEFLNANILGLCAAFSIIINLYLLSSKKIPIWSMGLALVSVVVLIASGSRKAFISIFLGIVLYLMLRNFKEKRWLTGSLKLIIVLPIVIIVGYNILQLPYLSGIIERINGLIDILNGDTGEKSAMLRFILIRFGMNLFQENPIWGIGIDNPRLYTYALVGDSCYLHNNYVEILSSGGIIGFVVYYWIYVKLMISYVRKRNFADSQYCICLVLLLIYLFNDYGMVSYYMKSTYMLLLPLVLFEKRLHLSLKTKE